MGALKSSKCSRGHRWTEKNTIIRSNGQRECRACKHARYEEKKQKRQAA